MKTKLLNCPAPAKLNLFLHVVGRRDDGYHLLQTVFQLLDFCDYLDFVLREDEKIVRENELDGIPLERDLVFRAAVLFKQTAEEKIGRLPGISIKINKKIPFGGGLGGGSSDAATTLMALNFLWNINFSKEQLMQLGLKLGADVPFFILGKNAFAEGVGEKLVSVETSSCWFVVISPNIEISTGDVFGDKQLTRNTKIVKITDFPKGNVFALSEFGKNDLQDVAVKRFKPVAEVLEWLAQYGKPRMTGSGACVFCPFSREEDADKVLEKVPKKWSAYKARSIAEHPMETLLKTSFA